MTTARAGRFAGLTQQSVVASALDLLDRDGLDGFSMRALARELGVQVGALYVHVQDREALLADVAGLIVAEVELPTSAATWDQSLRAFAHSYRAALHRHAGAAALVSGQLVSNGPQDFPVVEALLTALSRAGLKRKALLSAYNVYLGWLVGFVGVELAPAPPSETGWAQRRQLDLAGLTANSFPLMARHRAELATAFAVRWRSGAEAPMDETFTAALEVVLAGLATVHNLGLSPARARATRT